MKKHPENLAKYNFEDNYREYKNLKTYHL